MNVVVGPVEHVLSYGGSQVQCLKKNFIQYVENELTLMRTHIHISTNTFGLSGTYIVSDQRNLLK